MNENKSWVAAMMEIRRSNAAVAVPSGKKYRRKPRTQKSDEREK